MTTYATPAELEAGLDHLRAAPRGEGIVEMIVRRPVVDERELVDEAELDLVEGLVGDSWRARGRSGGRPANEKAQPPENPMSADRVRWEHIQRVYELCNRNVSETARRLNMHRRTLQRILAKRAPK